MMVLDFAPELKAIIRHQRNNIEVLIRSFTNSTNVPAYGAWQEMGNNDFWKRVFYGVTEVGSSAPFEKLESSAKAQEDLKYENLLSISKDHNDLLKHINSLLRRYGARYAARDPLKCGKSKAIVKNLKFLYEIGGPKNFFNQVGTLDSDYAKVKKVMNALTYIGQSNSRDILIEIGAAADLIIIDTRIINTLNALGIELPKNCTSNEKIYRETEVLILDEICKPLSITGARFDRTLYQNYKEILEMITQSMQEHGYYV